MVTPPPGGGQLPEEVVSGRARLRGPSGCVKQAFRARVSGREIRSVAFFVDGKLVKQINRRKSVYKVKIRPNQYGFGRHRVVARVRFTAESGTSARRLPLTFRRCAPRRGRPALHRLSRGNSPATPGGPSRGAAVGGLGARRRGARHSCTNAAISRSASSSSGCQSTPSMKRRVGSSIASTVASPSARAVTRRPSPTRSTPWWW